MKKLYLIMLVLAGFALQASASVTYTMLSATKTGGNEGAEKLLDGQGSTKWGETLNNGNSRWIVFKASAGIMPSDYVLTVANDTPGSQGRQWKKWRIYGANFINDFCATRDANGWVLLDSKQDITDEQFPTGSSNQTYLQTTFTLSEECSTYYEYFKIEVDEIRSSGQYMQMGDFAFGTYTEQTTAELYGVKVNLAKNLDMTGLDESDVWSLEAPVIIGGLDEAYANAQNSGDYSALQSSLDVAVKLSTGIARLVSNGNISAFDGSACWGDGHYTQLFDGKDGISPNDGTKWGGDFSGNEGDAAHVQYVIFRVKEAFAPYFYKLVTGGDTERFNGRNWKTWSVYGANFASIADATRDADGWVELDKRENISEEYLPMKNNYPAAFNFLSGVSEPYLYYMVKVFAAHNGNQTQMNEMYLCTQEEFDAARAPLVAYFDDFDLTSLVTEDGLDAEKASFAAKLELLKTTSDAVEMTKLYNELVALREMLEESAAFIAGGYRSLAGNTAWGDNENWTKLVDGDINTKWGGNMPTDGTGSYIIFKTNEANAFNQYMLVTGNDTGNGGGARNWKTWKIYGIDAADEASVVRDAEGWTLIDEKTDIGQDRLPAANFAPAYFNFTNPQGFKYFKIEVASAYSGGSIQMAEFKMLSDEEYAAERQVYVDSLQKVALAKFAEYADVEVPAAVMQAIQAAATAKMNAVATATADDLLPAFNAALNFINVEALEMAAAAIPEKVDGVYQIANAMQLVYFQGAVNAGETEANAVVVADIDLDGYTWTPIGNETTKYAGTFDGQGHSIENFSYTATSDYNGLFGYVVNAHIKNFTISGTLTSDGYTKNGVIGNADGMSVISGIHSALTINVSNKSAHSGGVVGGDAGDTANAVFVEGCEYSGTMTHIGAGDCQGGILGYTGYGGVKNCIFSGTIIGTNSKYGGILAYCRRPSFMGVQNCLSIGKIVADADCTTAAAIIANYNGDATTAVKNNYYLLQEGSTTTIAIGNRTTSCEAPVLVTAEQLASGEVAYLLNESKSEDVAWFQTLSIKDFVAEQYVVTADGATETPTAADITLADAGDGTFTFTLPDFTLSIIGRTLPVGDISLTGVEIAEDGTFSQTSTYDVPDENIAAAGLTMFASAFKNIPYTLEGKVNDDRFFATIDMTVTVMSTAHTVNVVVGVDDFEAVAPALTCDEYPVLDATHRIVYMDGRLHCNGDIYEDATFTNEVAEALQDDHDFVCGFCTYCGAIDETYDGTYEIATAAQLKSFATVVNTMNNAANAILVADIDMTEAGWPKPIGDWSSGNVSTAYAGHFDGQGHAITNLKYTTAQAYHGLFGVITEGALIENFSISGDITSTVQYAGSVAGYARETPVIKNVHSSVNITNNYGGGRQGGILGGSMNGTVTIERCWYSGKLIAGELSGNYGGIVGYINNNSGAYCNITDCLFDGVLYNGTAGGQCGGVVGYNNGGKATLTNCLSIGTLTSGAAGQFFGALNGNNSTYVNCYYQGTVAQTGTGTPKGETPVTVTDEELESGEICTALGDAWGQDLGTDAYPHPVPEGSKTGLYLEIAVSAAGYATFVPKYNVAALPEGVTAFVGQKMGTYVHLEEVTALPADNAFIVKADEGVYYCDITTEAVTLAQANDLTFSAENVTANGTQYVLAKPEGEEVGFYKATAGTTIKPYKGYLIISGGDAKAFYGFDPDNGTGIAEVEKTVENGAIYNLAGQRIGKMQKGINIINGKKVLK